MGNFIYFVVMIIAIIIANIAEKNNKRKYLIGIVFIISMLSGFRGINVGIDTKLYTYAFLHDFPYKWHFEEIGFRFISTLIFNIFNDTRMVFLFFALIINGFIIYRLWDFKDKCSFTFMLMFYLLTYYIDSMNIMRQLVAVAIIFFSTRLLEKKRYILFIIIVILTTFIHTSSLLALALVVAYIWAPLKMSSKVWMFFPIALIGIIAVQVILQYEAGHIDNYLSEKNSVNNINIPFLYRLMCFFISYFLHKSNKKIVRNKSLNFSSCKEKNIILYDEMFSIVAFIYFMGLSISSLGMFFVVMARLGYFYILFEVVYWGYLVKTSKNKIFNFMMIIIYVGYIFLVEVFSAGCEVFPFYLNI